MSQRIVLIVSNDVNLSISRAQGSFLYRLLREEFVTNYKKPLNSDAFSGFSATEPKSKEYNADIKEAFQYYIKELIPVVAFELSQMPAQGVFLP